MQARTIDNQPDTYAVIFETGDEVAAGQAAFAQQHHLTASHFSAIGGFEDVTLGYFDWSKKEYTRTPLTEQVEVLSLIGDIALDQGNAESPRPRDRREIRWQRPWRPSAGGTRQTYS